MVSLKFGNFEKTSNRESGHCPERRTYRVTNLSRRRRIRSTSTKGSPLGGAHSHPEVGNEVRQLRCLLPKSFNTKISRNNTQHTRPPARGLICVYAKVTSAKRTSLHGASWLHRNDNKMVVSDRSFILCRFLLKFSRHWNFLNF